MRERPDWVCEILSSNRKHDTITKFEVLGRAGVRHYWLLDVDARELVVHRLEGDNWVRVGSFVANEPGQQFSTSDSSKVGEEGDSLDPKSVAFLAAVVPALDHSLDRLVVGH